MRVYDALIAGPVCHALLGLGECREGRLAFVGMNENDGIARRFIETLEARDWTGWAELLDPEVVYEMPQTRERIRGRDTYLQFNQEYPGDWHLTARTVVANDSDAAVRFEWRVGDEVGEGIVFFGFKAGKIVTVTDFWPEDYDPPAGREHLVERW